MSAISSKMEEMSIDFRRETTSSLTTIRRQPIQPVAEYKCLGDVLDRKLQWDRCKELIQKKRGSKRLIFLKSWCLFLLFKMFYGAFVESVLRSGVICWFRRATEAQKNIQENHNHCYETARHRSERSSRHLLEIFHQSRESFIRAQEPAAGIC